MKGGGNIIRCKLLPHMVYDTYQNICESRNPFFSVLDTKLAALAMKSIYIIFLIFESNDWWISFSTNIGCYSIFQLLTAKRFLKLYIDHF